MMVHVTEEVNILQCSKLEKITYNFSTKDNLLYTIIKRIVYHIRFQK